MNVFLSVLRELPALLLNTLSIINFILIMQLLFGLNLCKKWQHYLVIAGIYMATNVGINLAFPTDMNIQTLWIYVAFIVIVCVLAKKRFWKYILYTIPTILLYVQWTVVVEMVDRLFGFPQIALDETGKLYGYLYLFADVLLVIPLAIWLAYVYRTGKRILLNVWETLVLCLFCIFSPLLVQYLERLESTFHDMFYSIIWVLFTILLNVAIFYGILHRSVARYYRGTAEKYKEQFNSEYNYFQEYKKQQKETAAFRHDWNNHMLLLQKMLANGDYEKVAEYFHSLTAEQISSGKRIFTGNEIVDIILSAKAEKIKEQRIKVSCNGGLEPLSFMEDVDICILFSNLIDNAIEANVKYEGERFLTIRVSEKPTLFMIEVSNGMSGELREKEGRILSSKADSAEHGIGTQNIFSVIRKYKGEYSIQTQNNIFAITILFPLNHLSQE